MGTITIFEDYTTKEPITMIGKMSGVCYGSDITDTKKNYKRGIHNLESGHGRTWEFPEVYMIIDGYSARVIRELYTHIGGAPTRVQASTRYIDYANGDFSWITPPAVTKNPDAWEEWDRLMLHTTNVLMDLENKYHIPHEDTANGLPLGMTTKMVYRVNLRTLIDMSHQRMCACAYWEFRQLFNNICKALKEYSTEWAYLVENYFVPKCEVCGYCNETGRSCGRRPLKEDYDKWYAEFLKSWRADLNLLPG